MHKVRSWAEIGVVNAYILLDPTLATNPNIASLSPQAPVVTQMRMLKFLTDEWLR
jgi:hypothetical protein